jgi:hypothetical protein
MNKKTILIGLGVLAVAGIGYYMWKKKSETTSGAEEKSNAKGGDWAWTESGKCPYGYTLITSGPDKGWCKKNGGGAITRPMGGGKGISMTRG